jgi:hypothetical protein
MVVNERTATMKTNAKQNDAWVKLFLAILQENGYYENLRAWARKHKVSLKVLAHEFYNHMDKIPDGMGPYFYLDTFEDVIPTPGVWEMESIGEIIDYIYDHYLWKE